MELNLHLLIFVLSVNDFALASYVQYTFKCALKEVHKYLGNWTCLKLLKIVEKKKVWLKG